LLTLECGAPSPSDRGPIPNVELPPGARRTLSLGDAEGALLMAFEGDGPPSAWVQFFDRSWQERGWRSVVSQQDGGSRWFGHYRLERGSEAAVIDIQFSRSSSEPGLVGLLTVTTSGPEK
jgi:hypothetical protein